MSSEQKYLMADCKFDVIDEWLYVWVKVFFGCEGAARWKLVGKIKLESA